MLPEDPEFPPLLTGVPVDADIHPAELAFARALAGSSGAGDIFWSRDIDSARLAIILEPEIAAEKALCMLPLAMVALADSIGAIGPPNLPITFDWPKTILANGAIVGGFDIRFPPGAERANRPEFLLISLDLDIMWDSAKDFAKTRSVSEPGENLTHTVLHEEGAGDLDRTQIIQSWARHFTAWVDTWEHDGFKSVHENWLFRAHRRNELTSVTTSNETIQGLLIGMDEYGGLLIKQDNTKKLISLGDIWFGRQAGRTDIKVRQ